MRTALYGGSFDPIHHGHLILAREALEQFSLDRIVFIPAAQSPFKLDRQPASPAVRWKWSGRRLPMSRASNATIPRSTGGTQLHRRYPGGLARAASLRTNFSTSSGRTMCAI
jgi:cytidyltransferase-like protein